ncbi:MAG: YodL domain-containing protein [Frisingicoccus sp.]|nr:YodL domain-containing protein [Frisingicoccus sp.]
MEYETILKKQEPYWKEQLENLPGNPYVYGIYQMIGSHDGLFLPLRYWKNGKIEKENYTLLYAGETDTDNLDRLYLAFGNNPDGSKPQEFLGRTLSVSDVIVMRKAGKEPGTWSAWFVEDIGFTDMTEQFITENKN